MASVRSGTRARRSAVRSAGSAITRSTGSSAPIAANAAALPKRSTSTGAASAPIASAAIDDPSSTPNTRERTSGGARRRRSVRPVPACRGDPHSRDRERAGDERGGRDREDEGRAPDREQGARERRSGEDAAVLDRAQGRVGGGEGVGRRDERGQEPVLRGTHQRQARRRGGREQVDERHGCGESERGGRRGGRRRLQPVAGEEHAVAREAVAETGAERREERRWNELDHRNEAR